MKIPQSVIENISVNVDIITLINEYVTLTRAGSNYKGLCPFHNEKTPSFTVSPDKNIYKCFGCGKSGSIFQFIMDMESLSFPEAVRFIAKKYHISIPEMADESPEDKKKDNLFLLYEKVTILFEYLLFNTPDGEKAFNYMADRSFETETLKKFRLGFAPKDRRWLYGFLKKKNFSEQFLVDSGLFSKNYPQITLFSNRIMFPIFNVSKKPVAFSGRLIEGEGPKYINSPETILYQKKKLLYGFAQAQPSIRKSKYFVLCEGNFDVLALHQSGIGEAVAPLGTSFTIEQAQFLKRYAAECRVAFDGDKAGFKAIVKASAMCESFGLENKVIVLGENNDPSDILQKDGKEILIKVCNYPINTFEYLLKCASGFWNLKNLDGKGKAINLIKPLINSSFSDMRRSEWVNYLSDFLKIDVDALNKELKNSDNKSSSSKGGSSPGRSNHQYNSDDLFLMLAVIANIEYFNLVLDNLAVDDLIDPRAIFIYNLLKDFEYKGQSDINSLMENVREDDLRTLIFNRISSGEFDLENPDTLIKDTLYRIKVRSMMKKRVELESLIRMIERTSPDNSSELNILLKKKIELDKALTELKVSYNG